MLRRTVRQRRETLGVVRDLLKRVHALHDALGEEPRVPLPDQPELDVSYDHLLRLEDSKGPDYAWLPEHAHREYKVAELLDGVRRERAIPAQPQGQRARAKKRSSARK